MENEMLKATLQWTIVAILAASFVVPNASSAKNAQAANREQVLANLQQPPVVVDADAEGVAKRRRVERGDRIRERFDAHLETFLFANEADAEAAVFTLLITNGTIATCTLEFDEFDPLTGQAQYNVDIRSNGIDDPVERKGSCVDMDMNPVLPDAMENDSAQIQDAGGAVILEGFFRSRGRNGD
jgi:hypothetical protein